MTIQTPFLAALTVLALLFTFASAALMPTTAQAKEIRFHASAGQVAKACKASGGLETSGNSPVGGYGCTKMNCDGKGGNCLVDCTNTGSCTGTTPRLAFRHRGGFAAFLRLMNTYQPPQSIVESSGGAVAPVPSSPAPSAPTPPIFN